MLLILLVMALALALHGEFIAAFAIAYAIEDLLGHH